MEAASLAAMVMFQITAEPDVSKKQVDKLLVLVTEKSSALIDLDVLHVTHTLELKEEILFASLTTAQVTKSSLG